MHMLLKSKVFILFNSFVFLSIVFSLNYSVGNYILEIGKRPFDLSRNYEIYEKDNLNSKDFKGILNIPDSDFVMILEKDDALGIYDPMMYYYLKSTKVTMPNEIRYFSKNDYDNDQNVGICVKGCSLFDNSYLKTLSVETKTEIINCFENSPLAVDDIQIVHNLFSLNIDVGDHIYIDSMNHTTLNQLDSFLQESGFKKIDKTNDKSVNLLDALNFGLQNKYSFYLIFANIMLLLLTIITSYVYFSKIKRKLELDFFYGCTISTYIKTFFVPFILIIILCSSIMTGIIFLFASDLLYLSLTNYLIILTVYTLFLVFLYFINFMNIYKEIKRGFHL